jgi:ABC-2 type transport system permease protein
MIAAILRAQWLSMQAWRLGSRRRGAVFSLITGAVWYGFWTVLAISAFSFTSNPQMVSAIEFGLPFGLLFIMLYWQLAPLVSASLGASLDLKKLLIYPVRHSDLFLIEAILRLTTCLEMVLVLGGLALGLMRNPAYGAWANAWRVLPPFVLFIVFNLLLAAGTRNLLERLLLRKRVREVMVLFFVILGALPQLFIASGSPTGRLRNLALTAPSVFWPWSATALAAIGERMLPALAVLASWSLVAYAFGRRQFERSLRYDAQAAQAMGAKPARDVTESWVNRICRIPSVILPDPLGALVEKELRTLIRTPRFRLVFIMGFSFGLIVWLPLALGRHEGDSMLANNFLTVVSVYALTLLGQVSYWNAFGFDRSAAQVYFSLPVPISRALAGKNIAAATFIFLEMAAVSTACLLLRFQLPPFKILEAFLVTPVVGLYLLALGNLSSIHYPRAMNPERVAQGGAASRFQALMFLLYPIAMLPVFLAYLARYAFGSQLIFYLMLAFAALLGGVIYWIAMDSAVSAAYRRRELLLTELSRSEGPVVTE